MATPTNATVGAPITAGLFNQVVANLTPATAYTPTISNWASATTSPTTSGYYWITGGICHVVVNTTLGSGAATVGVVTVSLPIPMVTTGFLSQVTALNGASSFFDNSANTLYNGYVRWVDANTVAPLRPSGTSTGVYGTTTASLPFAWATLDQLTLAFSYPIA